MNKSVSRLQRHKDVHGGKKALEFRNCSSVESDCAFISHIPLPDAIAYMMFMRSVYNTRLL